MTVNVDPLCPQQHTHPKHNPNRCIFCEYGAAVRADALNAAEAAVKALVKYDHNNYALVCDANGWAIDRDEALAAIRALKEKP